MEPATIDLLTAILTAGIMAATIWWITPQPIQNVLRFLVHGTRTVLRWCWFVVTLPFLPMRLWWYFQQEKPKFVLFTTIAMLKTVATLVCINPLLIVGTVAALLVQVIAFLVSLLLGKAAMRRTTMWLYWSLVTLQRLLLDYVPPFLRNVFGCGNIVRHLGGHKQLQRGIYLLARAGYGKSNLLKNIVWYLLKKRHAFLLIEPHGELTNEVLSMHFFRKNHRSRARERLVVYDLESDHPTEMSLFNVPLPSEHDARMRAIDALVPAFVNAFQTTFINLNQPLTGGMDEVLENLVAMALEVSHTKILTLMDFMRLLAPADTIDAKYTRLFKVIQNPMTRQYFETTFFDAETKKSKSALRKRLGRLVRNRALQKSLGGAKNTINFADIFRYGNILIVKASKGKVGAEASIFVGVFINTLMYHHAFARLNSTARRIPFFVILDECHNYVSDPNLEHGINELRKTDTHFILSHQVLNQGKITPSQQKAFKSLNIKICGALEDSDALEMSRALSMKKKEDELRELGIGEFFVKVGKQQAKWVKLNKRFALAHEKVGKVRHSIYMRDDERAELDRYLAARQRGAPARPKPKEKPQTTKEQKQHVSKRANTTTYTVDHFEL